MSTVVFAARWRCAVDALAFVRAASSVYFLLDKLQSSLAVIGRVAWIEQQSRVRTYTRAFFLPSRILPRRKILIALKLGEGCLRVQS